MLCMIAKLDNEATEKLLSLQRIALSAMPAIKPLHGHITIAAYMGENETAFRCRPVPGTVYRAGSSFRDLPYRSDPGKIPHAGGHA